MSATAATAVKHKILLLDDDPDVLNLYQQVLLQLPSEPEVHIATSGASALAMLDAESFNLLVSDLTMPRMDGLQVLAIVRRKFPQMRTVVLTGVADEQMRARSYAMGIDLYLEKPKSEKEMKFFTDCLESLIDSENSGGFRGVQSKSLVDLIQLECLSGNSAILKITNGRLEGCIWIQNGDVIDAETDQLTGEDAFKKILSWKSGNFETVAIDSERPRRILTSYQGLLLDTAQALDEAADKNPEKEEIHLTDTQFFKNTSLGRIQGVEYALKIPQDLTGTVQKWGVEDPAPVVAWVRGVTNRFHSLNPGFEMGVFDTLEARSLQRILHVCVDGSDTFVVSMLPTSTKEQIEESSQKVRERWGS